VLRSHYASILGHGGHRDASKGGAAQVSKKILKVGQSKWLLQSKKFKILGVPPQYNY